MVSLKGAKSPSCPAPIQLVQKHRQLSPEHPDKETERTMGTVQVIPQSLNWSDNHSGRDSRAHWLPEPCSSAGCVWEAGQGCS